ncbi:MAG: hypothetical protein ACI4Q4_09145, partial [Oscillospiraceae bacterium]
MQKTFIKRIAVAAALMLVSIFALGIDMHYVLNEMDAVAADGFTLTDNTCTINSADDLVAFSESYQN